MQQLAMQALPGQVCELDGVVPRKELHENWEAASRIHSHFPDAMRVADLASGNGLLSWYPQRPLSCHMPWPCE